MYGGKIFLNTLGKLLDVQTLLLLDKVNFFFVKMHHIRYKNVQFHVQTQNYTITFELGKNNLRELYQLGHKNKIYLLWICIIM